MSKAAAIAAVLLLAVPAVADVHPDTRYERSAQLVSDLVMEHLDRESYVSIDGPDDHLVVFVALGGGWEGDEEDETALVGVYAIASGVDYEMPWDASDVAVSFGDMWFRIPMEDVFWLSDSTETLTEEEWMEEMWARTEVRELDY